MIWFPLVAAGLLGTAEAGPSAQVFTFSIVTKDASDQDIERSYAASIERPAEPNGWRVMLLSGGYMADIDWTMPGSFVDQDGTEHRFTIDGEPTRDGQAISAELVEHGYTVWRYSSIHTEDALHAQDSALAEPVTFETSIEIARAALAAFDARDGEGPVVLLGHSLGATRSVLIGADADRVRGFVFLAGAYLSGFGGSTSSIDELGDPGDQDFDGDGVVRGWESAASDAARDGRFTDRAERFRDDLEWPIESLVKSRKPTLAIFGGLDRVSVHGPVLDSRAKQSGVPIEVVYIRDRDHQLAITRDGRTSPIDPAVVDRIRGWLDTLRERAESE